MDNPAGRLLTLAALFTLCACGLKRLRPTAEEKRALEARPEKPAPEKPAPEKPAPEKPAIEKPALEEPPVSAAVDPALLLRLARRPPSGQPLEKPALVVQSAVVSSSVADVRFTPDGQYMAMLSAGSTVSVWEVATARMVRVVPHGNAARLDISPDGRLLATGSFAASGKGNVRIWQLIGGKEVARFDTPDLVSSLAFSPDGKWLVSCGREGTLLIDLAAQSVVDKIKGDCWSVVRFRADSGAFAFSKQGHTAVVVDLATRARTEFGGGIDKGGMNPTFSNGGTLLATEDNWSVYLWDLGSKKLLQKWRSSGAKGEPGRLVFSPDDKLLAVSNFDQSLRLFDVATGALVRELPASGATTFSKDGARILSSAKGSLVLLDVATGKPLWRGAGLAQARFLADGALISGVTDQNVQLLDAATGRTVRTFEGQTSKPHGLRVSSDGRFAASILLNDEKEGRPGGVDLWDLATGKRHFEPGAAQPALSADGLVAWNRRGSIELRDAATRRLVRTISSLSYLGSPSRLRFSPDGKTLVAGYQQGSNPCAFAVDAATGEKRARFSECRASDHIAFSADSKRVAFAGEVDGWKEGITVFNVNDGSRVAWLENDWGGGTLARKRDWITGIALNHDGSEVAMCDFGGPIDVRPLRAQRRTIGDSPVYSIESSADGHKLLAGDADGGARLYGWDGKLEREWLAQSYFTFGAFTKSGSIFTSGSEGAIKLWDKDAELQATFIAVGADGYVVALPDNHYLASKGVAGGVAFRIDERAYPFDQFDLRLNRPDLVLGKLGYAPKPLIDAYAKAHQRRLKRLGFTEKMLSDDIAAPAIRITPTQEGNKLRLAIEVSDAKYALARIDAFANNVPLASVDLREKATQEHTESLEVTLAAGKNLIEISAINEKGIESLKESVQIETPPAAVKPTALLVAVGVSKYADAEYNLTYAAKDARDLSALLSGMKDRFAEVKVLPILDGEATAANIRKAKDFLMTSRVDDEAIVFFAGHGLLDDKLDYYLATADTDFKNPAAHSLPYEDFQALLDGIPARKKLLLVDACNSGEVDKQGSVLAEASGVTGNVKSRGFKVVKPKQGVDLQSSFELLQQMFDLRRGTGAMEISSASGKEFAFESSEWQNGVFTYALLQKLKAGKPGMKVSELRAGVIEEVQKLTRGQQTPTSRLENLLFDFPVY